MVFICWFFSLISIHAPIVGCDTLYTHVLNGSRISIHAPIVGCDRYKQLYLFFLKIYFNPRTHRGVRLSQTNRNPYPLLISIHAPIVGCDETTRQNNENERVFQSTHPSWGATEHLQTHTHFLNYFNPRTHRGVRRYIFHLSKP